MGKGNPNPTNKGEHLPSYTKAEQDIIEQAKVLAMNVNRHKYKQSDVYRMIEQATAYVEEQQKKNKPLTVAGFMLATNTPETTWREMRDGDKDNITALYQMQHADYINDDGEPFYVDEETGEAKALLPFSWIVKNCYLLVQNQLEGNCYTNKGNPAGSIFGLKALFNWRDDATPQHLTQVVQICDAEQAQKALKMLYD